MKPSLSEVHEEAWSLRVTIRSSSMKCDIMLSLLCTESPWIIVLRVLALLMPLLLIPLLVKLDIPESMCNIRAGSRCNSCRDRMEIHGVNSKKLLTYLPTYVMYNGILG